MEGLGGGSWWKRQGVGADTQSDSSRTAEIRGQMLSWVTDWLATLEDMSSRSIPSSRISFTRQYSWSVSVSSWVVMATMPDPVAHSIESMDLSPAVMVCRPWGERLWNQVREQLEAIRGL